MTLADDKSERDTREREIRAVYPVTGAAQISVSEGRLASVGETRWKPSYSGLQPLRLVRSREERLAEYPGTKYLAVFTHWKRSHSG